MHVYDNILTSGIVSITKEPTIAPVEYYLIPECDQSQAILVASLEPFQVIQFTKLIALTTLVSIMELALDCLKEVRQIESSISLRTFFQTVA